MDEKKEKTLRSLVEALEEDPYLKHLWDDVDKVYIREDWECVIVSSCFDADHAKRIIEISEKLGFEVWFGERTSIYLSQEQDRSLTPIECGR